MASPVLPPPLVSMSDMGNFIAIAGMAVAQAGQHAKPASTDDFVASVQGNVANDQYCPRRMG